MEEYPDRNMEVLAVWFSMFPGDSRESWPPGLLSDARVQHFWDAGRISGREYGKNGPTQKEGDIMWDAYFLYAPGTEWAQSPPEPFSWGRTIAGTRNQLKEALEQLLQK